MATVPSLANPTKDHPLYGKYTKTAIINKSVKLAVLAVVIIYLITVFFAPVFTASTEVKDAAGTTVYQKTVSYKMAEILDEQKKFNDEEAYFEDVEESVKYLKGKDFSELERIKNLEKADQKINASLSASDYIQTQIDDMADNRPLEYIALAEKANAIEGYTTNANGERIPVIHYSTVANYLKNIEINKIAMLSKIFYAELEARNTDGLREFLFEVENLNLFNEAGYTSEYAESLKALQNKYLVADYTFDEEFCATLNAIANVNQFIPDSAMTKQLAETIDMYNDMSDLAYSSYASTVSQTYKAKYIYFEYDLDTNKLVYEQHDSIKYINLAVNTIKLGVLALVSVAVIAMIPTAVGLITRKHKKLRSLSFLYFTLPLFGMLLATLVSGGSLFVSQIGFIDVTCEIGNALPSAFLVILLIFVATIVTKILVTVYGSKYNKWLKEVQAAAQNTVGNDALNDAPTANATEEKNEDTND